jgi:hypothetical protein
VLWIRNDSRSGSDFSSFPDPETKTRPGEKFHNGDASSFIRKIVCYERKFHLLCINDPKPQFLYQKDRILVWVWKS